LQHTAPIRRAFDRAAVQLAGERDGQIITLKLIDLSIPKIPLGSSFQWDLCNDTPESYKSARSQLVRILGDI
jgi:hypothetical protein